MLKHAKVNRKNSCISPRAGGIRPKPRIKCGYVVNVEQAVTDDIGLFVRWSWNDGKSF